MGVLSKASLFDPELVTDLVNKVKGKSSLAVLAKQVPVPFDGSKEFTFSMDQDIDIVAENGKKTHGGVTLAPVTIVPIKVEYGARVSEEFMFASEERKIEILKAFNEGYALKLARGIDLMAFHGINPRTKVASTIIGNNSFDGKVTQTVDFDKANPDANIEAAVGMVQGSEGSVTGMAMDTVMSAALSAMRTRDDVRVFPELTWGANPGSINGLPTDINRTVSGGGDDLAIVGDFANMFKWGYAKEIPLEVIPYGDPDNSGEDLKGHNQVYLRSETYVGWGIMDGTQFARVIKPKVEA
ncbi:MULTISPECIES: phage major capsid protein [Latilactobacillus]|uniref:Phage major capsid protein n=1 Tax=Latilactobacillus curvatus TaxID=28038 RepID=A0A385AEU7_LATCU|nr:MULTISPECIES: phage major capsid protein [Latilactobacillus]WEU69624.1 major capsid protein [Latilactobacillus phage TMW 1.1381 P1]AWV73270.1 phage major capsid protein [Latilactobacillus curvatus]AXN36195.1 phage major capsid protein [Latilactobacillus curvatus]MCT3525895.1 phage major capsid protein [Latilactobacillus curvatus]MDG2976910.1 phage major capsid protein [Latilactobacillus curvatus]